jgi:peptidoglycan/xylan/chitin deacetylase (PgdA/CDA1 family)
VTARVPILCYHRVETPPRGHERDANFVTPACFEAHLHALARLGCTGVPLRDFLAWQRGERSLPARAVVITFDDGYESVATEALPRLAARGWGSSLFLVAGHLGDTNRWDPTAPPARLLDAVALRGLASDRVELGAHTMTHRRVTGLNSAELRVELVEARERLASALGRAVETFAFPYGTHRPPSLHAVREAGYAGAVTLKRWGNGRGTNPYRLGRLSVGGEVPAWLLVAKLLKVMCTPPRPTPRFPPS